MRKLTRQCGLAGGLLLLAVNRQPQNEKCVIDQALVPNTSFSDIPCPTGHVVPGLTRTGTSVEVRSVAALRIKLPSARSIRLTAGLIMFTYATCHLISHATGLFLLDAIERIGHDIILAPWRTPFGLSLLLAAFLTHLGLGLWALYRRRHLRMPAIEAWQLGFGLTIPLLLAPHVTDARLGVLLYGLEDSYFRVLYLVRGWRYRPAGPCNTRRRQCRLGSDSTRRGDARIRGGAPRQPRGRRRGGIADIPFAAPVRGRSRRRLCAAGDAECL